jgi:hypothetical protein
MGAPPAFCGMIGLRAAMIHLALPSHCGAASW